jgi:hypothetical protein
MRTNYQIGYQFEYRVRKWLELNDVLVVRSAGSKFPDMMCVMGRIMPHDAFAGVNPNMPFFVECKCNKYLSKKEKIEAGKLTNRVRFFVAWKKKSHKIDIYEVKGDQHGRSRNIRIVEESHV